MLNGLWARIMLPRRHVPLGIVRGVRHAEVCTQGMKHVQIVGHSNLLMQILDRGRVDIVITALINGLLQLKKLNLDSIYPLSTQ